MRRPTLLSCVLAALPFGLLLPTQAQAAQCSSYGFIPILCDDFDTYCDPPPGAGVCDPNTASPDNNAFLAEWVPDATCSPVAIPNYLASGVDVLGSYGSMNVQHGREWSRFRANRVYRHVRDLTSDILAHPDNTAGCDAINGAGPIEKPLFGNSVPPEYVDSMNRTLRPDSLKGTFYFHPLDGANKAGLANMIYYHELYLDDDRAPTNYTATHCCPVVSFRDSRNAL
ncbi:MAG TPA: hypothetical protein VLM89_15575 [Phycisphaerae bacterium]|nr:hypothetical protein [Phycisphaerae bacterium]